MESQKWQCTDWAAGPVVNNWKNWDFLNRCASNLCVMKFQCKNGDKKMKKNVKKMIDFLFGFLFISGCIEEFNCEFLNTVQYKSAVCTVWKWDYTDNYKMCIIDSVKWWVLYEFLELKKYVPYSIKFWAYSVRIDITWVRSTVNLKEFLTYWLFSWKSGKIDLLCRNIFGNGKHTFSFLPH